MRGPEFVNCGQAPGGLVVHIYRADGRLVFGRSIGPDVDFDPIEDFRVVASRAEGQLVELAVFDGDTGRRWSEQEIEETKRWFSR